MYFYLIGKKNILTTSCKKLSNRFRATLNLWKNGVSLKKTYVKIFFKLGTYVYDVC